MAGREWLVWLCGGLGRPLRLAGALALVWVGPGPGLLWDLVGLTVLAALLGRWLVGLWLRGGPRAPRGRLPAVVVSRFLLAGLVCAWSGVLSLPLGLMGLGLESPSLAGPRGPLAGWCGRAWGCWVRGFVGWAGWLAGGPGPLRLGLVWLGLVGPRGPWPGLALAVVGLAGGKGVSVP